MFVAMGLSAIFPILHGVRLYGIGRMNDQIGLSWLVLEGFLYVSGAALYGVSGGMPSFGSGLMMVS